jgi:hypothetical protein
MAGAQIRIGSKTHTGALAGYCLLCGLHHDTRAVEAFCVRLRSLSDPREELVAWRELLQASAAEERV